jgi:hypothetical protein
VSVDHAAAARRLLGDISGDYVLAQGIPAPLAQLHEAQVLATLAVADALQAILGHLEDRAIMVAGEHRL